MTLTRASCQRRFARTHLGARRLDVAPDAAEEVELPESIEARLRRVELALLEGVAGQFLRGLEHLGVGPGERDGRKLIEADQPPLRTRRLQVRGRDLKVLVVGHRILDQAGEQRIIEQGPVPLGRISLREARLGGIFEMRIHRDVGTMIIRPDGAPADQRAAGDRERHAGPSQLTHRSAPLRCPSSRAACR